METKELTEQPGFYEKLSGYIEAGIGPSTLATRSIPRDFPNADLRKVTHTYVSNLLKDRRIWQSLQDRYPDKVNRLWSLERARRRATGAGRPTAGEEPTLEGLLNGAERQPRKKSGTKARKYR